MNIGLIMKPRSAGVGIVFWLTLSLLVLGESSRAGGYNEAIMHDFIGDCIYKGVGVAPPAYMSAWCHCTWRGVRAGIPFSEYEKLDDANLKDNPTVTPILKKCAGAVEPYLKQYRQKENQP